MADKCSCGGWIIKEVYLYKTKRDYFVGGYFDFTYPMTKPTYKLKCFKCGMEYCKKDESINMIISDNDSDKKDNNLNKNK